MTNYVMTCQDLVELRKRVISGGRQNVDHESVGVMMPSKVIRSAAPKFLAAQRRTDR